MCVCVCEVRMVVTVGKRENGWEGLRELGVSDERRRVRERGGVGGARGDMRGVLKKELGWGALVCGRR